MTQSIAFIPCSDEDDADRVLGDLRQPVYKFINDETRYGNFNCNRVLERLPLYGTFDLSPEELALIERFNAAY